MKLSDQPRICDYEGSDYRQRFWENADRGYEDQAERLALRRLLPAQGRRLVEIGAGFGRLLEEYRHFDEVYLLDFAPSMIADARARLAGARPGLRFVCADLYHLPFAAAALDTVVQVRVLHHVEAVESAVAEVARVLRAGGSYVLEYANKRNLKSLLRYGLGRQEANPLDPSSHEFVPLNWNHHPARVLAALNDVGLAPIVQRTVSLFRHPALKSRLPAERLAALDDLLAGPLAGLTLGPSQFLRALRLEGGGLSRWVWRCPACGHEGLNEQGDVLPCPTCGRRWPIVNGVYQFRQDLLDRA